MRIAITGASGLIGSAVVAALKARGDEAIRLVRPGSARAGVTWDPARGEIDLAALEGMDAVVHLAGESIAAVWTASRKRRILESRVVGTSLIATSLAKLQRPPRVLVSASAIGYYGDHPAGEPVDESAPKGSGFLADVVAQWEAAAQPARSAGIRVAHPRFGLVLDRNGGMLKAALPMFYVGMGGRLGSGKQIWSWVALDDVVGSVLHLIDHNLAGPVNVTAPNAVSNTEFTRELAKAVHRPALLPAPEFMLKLVGGAAEELVLYGVRAVPKKLTESGYVFRYPELRQALQAVLAGGVGA
jgi:uncharacterized protein (TIGR01777 family)